MRNLGLRTILFRYQNLNLINRSFNGINHIQLNLLKEKIHHVVHRSGKPPTYFE